MAVAATVVGLVRDGARIDPVAVVAPFVAAVAGAWVLLWMGSRSLRAARAVPPRFDVHDSRVNRWTLSLGGAALAIIVVAAGLASVPFCLGAAGVLLVLRRRSVRRAAELGRPMWLWDVVPLLGPGATIPLPPEAPPAAPAPPLG